jgi:dienelactone hydrolase
MIHGSAGMGPNIEFWTREFNEMGVSTFALDGFTGRGLTEVNTDQALLGRLNMILDVYRVLDILANHPRVDPSRIALMGFSRGGQGALYASLKRFHHLWNRSGIEFAAYISFYPDCMTTYQSDTEVADRPIRIFHGTADDYDPVGPCRAYVERLRSAQTVRRCMIREEATGQLINAATRQPFSYKDACVERDPHVGYDPAATQAARQSVKDLLKTVFNLN